MRTLRRRIDLNADLGESAERWDNGEDRGLLRFITSANVCCGAYAGDLDLITATCRAAAEAGVTIGAQIGYPDREGFGRVSIEMSTSNLYDTVRDQISYLGAASSRSSAPVRYVKPHGALYHDIASDEVRARAVMEAVLDSGVTVVLGLPGSKSLEIANGLGLTTVHEGFADRAYRSDGTLVPRSEPHAVLDDPADVADQALRLLETDIDTLCIHSDTPGALVSLEVTHTLLESAGVVIQPFLAPLGRH